ncbi:MAG: hypothetical protein WBD22_01075 [Pyrinomonadaceae bacterium]
MKLKAIILSIVLTCVSTLSVVVGQTSENLKPSVVTGNVVSAESGKLIIQTNFGPITVTLSDKTQFKRVTPENPTLKAAVVSALADITIGDRLVVTGVFQADQKIMPGRTVYLMSKSDIAERNQKESDEWKARGITGKVTSIDSVNKSITIEIRGLTGSTSMVVNPKEGATFRRYAPNSIKFSESVASSLSDVKPGDMLRALGDKSSDNTGFAAERIVTGAFQTVAGTVKSVDTVKNEVLILDFQSKKDVTIALGTSSVMKRFPEEMAQRLAQMQAAGGGSSQSGQARSQVPPTNDAGRQNPMRQGPNGPRGSIDEMLDRFPNISVADLKVGDAIAVSSTKNGSDDHIVAIKLLAGVEPFLRAAMVASTAGDRGRGSQSSGFTIPGLDGVDGP